MFWMVGFRLLAEIVIVVDCLLLVALVDWRWVYSVFCSCVLVCVLFWWWF